MSFRDEMRRWGSEVDAEAARLVRQGVPPNEAIERATKNVRRQRQEAARAEERRTRKEIRESAKEPT